ncbi:hypothetical protein [Antarcticimicrobium luteum]|uniref:Uncharacterized protein n=1 Tax=Antarcticimicrobium luteum TaxID=2547397 RepID=A0A4R5VGX5_9RHOB|nr:hypothetical protein [Antarcticimicrobium luteum]TDK52350.1 hypothetical protein E1832_01715 [Antarcticimicrobium luteum]
MTALREYERLEASGLWRPNPEDQRREVIVSVGEATLTIANTNDRALAHWSLAAVERKNPGSFPAIYHPDGDPGETLELAADEAAMIEAIERLRAAITRARPRPGRLRLLGVAASTTLVLLLLLVWLPGAMRRHTVQVVPAIKRQEIGAALLDRIERVAGRACDTPETRPVLERLARRTGARRLVVLRTGVKDTLHLPGGIILINRAVIEDYEDPAVAAGYILVERARTQQIDPLAEFLEQGGPVSTFRLLTSGHVTQGALDRYAEQVLTAPRPALGEAQILAAFAKASVPSTPYAYARDITGESVLGLIEADPMAGREAAEPAMPDRDWVLLQGICGG